MQKAYSRIEWENQPSGKTPLNESNLNKMDAAINELDDRIIELDLNMQAPIAEAAESAAKALASATAAAGSESAAALSENAAKASEEVCLDIVEEVRQKTVKATFGVNFATGQLEYDAPAYVFAINNESGNLEWGVR
jgi:hypothetical protein